jgi:hypothetical protein
MNVSIGMTNCYMGRIFLQQIRRVAMLVNARVGEHLDRDQEWATRWQGPDKGLITAWLAGQDYAKQHPQLAANARAGELPVLPFRGGVEKAIKVRSKIGHILYVAMWQGLRGDALQLDADAQIEMTCARHGVTVLFTADSKLLLATGGEA